MADKPPDSSPGGAGANGAAGRSSSGLPPAIHPAWGGRPARPFCPQGWEPRYARLVYHLADVHDEAYLRLVEQSVEQLGALHAERHGHEAVISEHEQLLDHLEQEHAQ